MAETTVVHRLNPTKPGTAQTEGKGIRRWFRRRSSSAPPTSMPTVPRTAILLPSDPNERRTTFTSERNDSFPNPPSSVEPPQIGPYIYTGSPAPPQSVPQNLAVIREDGAPEQPRYIGTAASSPPIASQGVRQSSHLPFATDFAKPKPPRDVLLDVLTTRLGTNANIPAELYEMEVTPPVRRPTPPPAIYINWGGTSKPVGIESDTNESTSVCDAANSKRPGPTPSDSHTQMIAPSAPNLNPPMSQHPMSSPGMESEEFKMSGKMDPGMNTSTWVSNPGESGLVPPVNQKPMISPDARSLAPPISQPPMSSPGEISQAISMSAYDIQRPTCSLNIVCYRGGSKGCVLRQIQTALKSRFPDQDVFQSAIRKNTQLIATDQEFFYELRRVYWDEMCGFWRRYLSLKTLTGLRLLAYSPSRRPAVVPLDDFVLQEIYYAYKHPDGVLSDSDWIEWVFRLRRHNKRHALEFVEGWNSTRVSIAAAVPWLMSCLVGIIWTAMGGDAQTAFTVAGFILTSGTVILALLAFISGIESSGRSSGPGSL